ncbi:EI24 domain-containing protein [Jannaschia ovalis]|uniref:EI24 domain-containing protein n=1 Tax=Jannaschia ovalis TaxID=3038773 RepID=A0ABY8LIA0_9RHOB|nr:EI24 domain-containing protein [Jannaschia sp. GRR-S6-38]WGH79904.1 EI24 domain-containing protein [Jannaschia sp. GRR-S6-38]
MIGDILRALSQLGDPRFRGVLLAGVGLSVALLAGFSAILIWGAQWLVGPSVTLPWLGEVTWLDNAAGWAAVPFTLIASIFLMVPVASAFTGLFLDRIADAVEARHYPGLPPARRQGWGEMLRESAGFLGLVVGVNLLALVAYLVLAPLALFIFWAVNGFLLGREYAQLVAARHLSQAEAAGFRTRYRGRIWGLGVLMAVPLSVPVLNLLVPVVGAAAFTHLFHRIQASAAR